MGCSWFLCQFFLGSWIRAQTGSFANVSAGTSPLYIKVGQILGLWKNGSWVLVDARRFFFVGHELEHAQEDLKNWWYRYMKVGQILGLSENGAWVLVDTHRVFFDGSWIRACTGSFGDVPKYFGLLKEVGYIAKWWVFTQITFFGSNFFRSIIRACTGSFANVYPGTSPHI